MDMKTPGVYIREKNAFPNSVVQVATAVPAFIGYTESAMNGNVPLRDRPMRITSLNEYHQYFGGAPTPEFRLQDKAERPTPGPYEEDGDPAMKAELPQAVFTARGPTGIEEFELEQVGMPYALYGAMRLFFINGGGSCFVISIGSYTDDIDATAMMKAIERLEKEAEPTMVVIPETTRLTRQDAAKVQKAMMQHCGYDMKNRFAILDIHGGYLDERSPRGDPIARFRDDIGANYLDYAAAYYPWLDTSIFQSRDFTFENIKMESRNKFISLLKRSVGHEAATVGEIKKVGVAQLTGDFTISVESGKKVTLKPGDIMAKDDSSAPEKLIYTVKIKPENMIGKLAVNGKEILDADAELSEANKRKEKSFTQQQVNDGKVTFTHDQKEKTEGTFDLIVTDEDRVQTSARTIKIVVGHKVLALADVEKGSAKAVIDVNEKDADEKSVQLIGADPVDKAEAIKNDPTGKAQKAEEEANKAQKELDELPDNANEAAKNKANSDASKAAEAARKAADAAIKAAEGKKLTLGGVGVWSVNGTKVTFEPDKTYRGMETVVRYRISIDGTVIPREKKVLMDGVGVEEPAPDPMTETIDKTMRAVVPLYTDVMNCITKYMNAMSPGAAMAGIYTMVDNSRGVWKAPANVSVDVVAPMVNIDHRQQENLNVSTTGKSINAIRPFVGEGTLVWGARTLDGNSLDWRYINVRRTMIMIEESIRLAAKAYVFEPNVANTWVTIRSMIENFLTSVWKAGGLAGAVPEDAFSVHVGLGETMTPVDILEGKLLITVLVAVSRPAEFIEITFQQQMQKS